MYRGRLEDGRLVAVKKLTRGSTEEKTMIFLGELGIITHTNHPNVAKLLGFSVDGPTMHLVLQLSSHGSLATFLFSNTGQFPSPSLPLSLSLSAGRFLSFFLHPFQNPSLSLSFLPIRSGVFHLAPSLFFLSLSISSFSLTLSNFLSYPTPIKYGSSSRSLSTT